MAAPVEAPTASSSDAERPTTSSVPEKHGRPHISSVTKAGSPEESSTKTQKPHDAILMHRWALNTSLWKIWMATIFFLQIKAHGIWKMTTNTMANQSEVSTTPSSTVSDKKSARCRMSGNVNPSESPPSLSPGCPLCSRSYLLRWLLRFDYQLLQFPPMLFQILSRTLLPPWRPRSNRGQFANWRRHCFRKHPHQLPVLARHWLHPSKKGCNPDLFFRWTLCFE